MIGRIINRFFAQHRLNRGIVSHSQCGEDLIINYVFSLRGVTKPSFLDIGANHPYGLSNTAFFYKRGSRGVNIEANPALIKAFQKHRKEDINLNVGVGPKEGELDFYVFEDHTLSTFSHNEYLNFIESGKKFKNKIIVPVYRIDQIVDRYCNNIFPDLLCVDAEGWDFEIIKSIDFTRHTPKVICIEAADFSITGAGKRRDDLIEYIKGQGYYEYANTNLNSILVQTKFWFAK